MKLQGLLGKKVAIHCNTESEANELLKRLYELGATWKNGQSLFNHNSYWFCKEETCYALNNIPYVGYDSIAFYTTRGYKIVEFTELKKEDTKMDYELILNGLKEVRKMCKSFIGCDGCPFCDEYNYRNCILQENAPCDLQLIDEVKIKTTVKLLKED